MELFCIAPPTRCALGLVGHENAKMGASNRTCPNGDCAQSNGREEKGAEEGQMCKDPLRESMNTTLKLAAQSMGISIHTSWIFLILLSPLLFTTDPVPGNGRKCHLEIHVFNASLPVSQSSVTLFHLGNRPIVSQPESGLRNPAMDGMVSQRGREDMDNGAC